MGTNQYDVDKNKDDQTTKKQESTDNKEIQIHHDDTTLKLDEQDNKVKLKEMEKLYGFKTEELKEQKYEFDLNNKLKIGDQELENKKLEFSHEENMGFLNSMNKNTEATLEFTKGIVSGSNSTVAGIKEMFHPGTGGGGGGKKI